MQVNLENNEVKVTDTVSVTLQIEGDVKRESMEVVCYFKYPGTRFSEDGSAQVDMKMRLGVGL